jgi:hypothetical protein
MYDVCCVCGQPATAACDASDCHNEMCDAHMYAHVVTSFDPRSAEHPDPPVQWFCARHKALADQ